MDRRGLKKSGLYKGIGNIEIREEKVERRVKASEGKKLLSERN